MFFGLIKIASSSVIGVDLGSSSIKAMVISKAHDAYQIEAVAETLLPKGLIVDNHLQDINKISLIIKQLYKNFPSHYKHAAIAVTGADVITKMMSMNTNLSELELENQVQMEVEKNVSFSLDELFIDFEVLGPSHIDPSINNVLVSTARKEQVLSQVQSVDGSGLITTIVDVASHALSRAISFILSPEDYHNGIVVIDIGASQMMLNILYQGQVIFNRSKNHGGEVCTQMIADHYGLSFLEAENMKISQRYPSDCEIDVLIPFMNITTDYLCSDLRMFTNGSNQIELTKVVLTGGGGLMSGLIGQLQKALEIEVVLAKPKTDFVFSRDADKHLINESGAKYMIALGLALRGII